MTKTNKTRKQKKNDFKKINAKKNVLKKQEMLFIIGGAGSSECKLSEFIPCLCTVLS